MFKFARPTVHGVSDPASPVLPHFFVRYRAREASPWDPDPHLSCNTLFNTLCILFAIKPAPHCTAPKRRSGDFRFDQFVSFFRKTTSDLSFVGHLLTPKILLRSKSSVKCYFASNGIGKKYNMQNTSSLWPKCIIKKQMNLFETILGFHF